jgi:hypothetical protein
MRGEHGKRQGKSYTLLGFLRQPKMLKKLPICLSGTVGHNEYNKPATQPHLNKISGLKRAN